MIIAKVLRTVKKEGGKLIFKRVKEMAEKKGISVSELEANCNIGNGTISKWKNSSPTITNLKKVADYFDVPIEYFLEE